jgi:spoIIIJ-associated protein
MSEITKQSEEFLNELFTALGLDLRASAQEVESGCLIDIEGEDVYLLRGEGGEGLDSVEHLVNQAFSNDIPRGERFICDVENFRAVREKELRAMARHAAERVCSSGHPFSFAPMNPNERRIIHLELSTIEQVSTESVGEGNGRHLVVSLRKPK